MSWPVVALGDHVDILSGFAFKSDQFNSSGDGLPLVRIRDVLSGVSETYYSGDYSDDFLLGNGDLLIGMDGDFNREYWGGGRALLNQRVCKVTANRESLDQKYLYYFLPRALAKIHAETPAVTVKHLSVKGIRGIEIPFPPLEEQKRIATILDKADAIRRKRQQAIQLADEFLRAVFLDMFGDIELNRWGLTTVEHMAARERGSMRTGPFGSDLRHSEFIDHGVAVLGIDNAVKNKFSWGKERFISLDKYEQLKRYKVKPGDVLITIMGTCGRCAVVPDDIPLAINTKHLCCITLDKERCLPSFLHAYFLIHPVARKYLGKTAKGAIMDGLNLGMIKEMPIPMVPVEQQARYESVFIKVSNLAANSHDDLELIKKNFLSLSQKAFSGDL